MARLVVYLSAAPGAGATRRLIEEGLRAQAAGLTVAVGNLNTKGNLELDRLASQLRQPASGREPNYTAEVVILDDLAQAERWRHALALRENGTSVFGAFPVGNVALDNQFSEQAVPLSFLQSADEVVAIDTSAQLLRLRTHIETADRQTLQGLRERLMRTIDNLIRPTVPARNTSTAIAYIPAAVQPEAFLTRASAIAFGLDLALEAIPASEPVRQAAREVAQRVGAQLLPEILDPQRLVSDDLRASLVAIPNGPLALKLANRRLDRDLFIVGSDQTYLGINPFSHPLTGTAGDRMRKGYGRLTVYLGYAKGAGKTAAMLDRARQLRAEGIEVVGALVDTHGNPEVEALLGDLELLPRSNDGVDREALIARRPRVALIDDLSHKNPVGSQSGKRYQDVLAALRAGIDVITTLNIQHLEALGDAIFRLTGKMVENTLPDGILALADEVVLIDVSPEELIERLRLGNIRSVENITNAASDFYRPDILASFRELALREAMRVRDRERISAPFERLLLSVATRTADVSLIRRCTHIAARLEVELAITFIRDPKEKADPAIISDIRAEAARHRVTLIEETAGDIVGTLLAIARSKAETTIAVAQTLRTPRWPQRNAFARQLLDAGARELLILATRPSGTAPIMLG
ncbi:MAG: hypothetical protein M3Y21_02695 [Candidatus Eremiobacteraeota bacterium]|nr:hypothetical protein [Candidatus Eremiobacteraeota bacterium]